MQPVLFVLPSWFTESHGCGIYWPLKPTKQESEKINAWLRPVKVALRRIY
jgi:hypothetical protein